jgi:hypothetical protein
MPNHFHLFPFKFKFNPKQQEKGNSEGIQAKRQEDTSNNEKGL